MTGRVKTLAVAALVDGNASVGSRVRVNLGRLAICHEMADLVAVLLQELQRVLLHALTFRHRVSEVPSRFR